MEVLRLLLTLSSRMMYLPSSKFIIHCPGVIKS
jgi:hypothetical protein